MSTALIPIEAGIIPASSPESLTNDQLVEIAVGTFRRIQDSVPYIIELRKRFKAAPRGQANIGGCNTWEQFCEKHLHRTASAIRKAIQSELDPPKPKLLLPAERTCVEQLHDSGFVEKCRKYDPILLGLVLAQALALDEGEPEGTFEAATLEGKIVSHIYTRAHNEHDEPQAGCEYCDEERDRS